MDIQEYDTHRRVVHTASGEMSYADVGSGSVALFIHGVGTNGYLWRHVMGELSGEYRCIALDLPLHGKTPVREDLSLTGLARSVEDFCAELDLTGVHLVANDTGGAVAQIVAAHQSRRLATFTLTNCETHDNVPPKAFKPTVWLARAGVLSLLGPQSLRNLRRVRKGVFGKGYNRVESLPLDVVRAFLEPVLGTRAVARQFERWLSSLHARDLLAVEPDLRKLTVPTLVVWGTGDIFFHKRWAYWLRDTIPGVTEVVEVDGARLFFPEERPGDLVPHLRRHWAAVAAT